MQYKFKEIPQRKDKEIEIVRGRGRKRTGLITQDVPHLTNRSYRKKKMNNGNYKAFPRGEGHASPTHIIITFIH